MKNNVALIGFMGTGKSAVGRLLAQKIDWKFVETDNLVEQIAGKKIPDIFREDGEIRFRELEIEAVKQAAAGKNQVIACGGGVVLNTINISRLKQNGVVVLLTAAASTILKRVSADKTVRPLLKEAGDTGERIRELMKLRQPFYSHAADIIVHTSRLNMEQTAESVLKELKNYAGFGITQ
ncbi:MAG TPA: shikimate kinase [Dehalococcoidales bacterium]|nr:shikimate kinase [Dehalococcoidales bacterium]